MGYKIVYDHQIKGGYYKRKSYPKLNNIIICITILALLIGMQIPPVREHIKQHILPEDWSITETAFDNLLQNIRNGEAFYDATAAFCQEIIDAGKEN